MMGLFGETSDLELDLAWGDWKVRGDSYEALAQLLHGPACVSTLLISGLVNAQYAAEAETSVWRGKLATAGPEAIASLEGPDAAEALGKEWGRLFGETEFSPLSNLLSPCETVYVAEVPDRHQREIVDRYCALGFPYEAALTSHCDCPGHVSVEFAFMAYALGRAQDGDIAAAEGSATFLTQHILKWVPLFAVVLQRKTTHPAIRFVAMATERFMCCEARQTGLRRH